MRALLINTENGWRGGEQQVWLLARGLGADALTVCQPGSPLARRLRDIGCPVHEMAMRSPWSPSAVLGLRRLVKQARLVHAHTSHAHTLAALASWGTGVPLIATRRVDFPPKGLWKYRRCTRVVAISQAIANVLAQAGVERLATINSGIDPARFAGADRARGRAALGLADGTLAVLCVAALEDHKDHRTLLEAWGRLANAHPQAQLLLAGDGSLRAALEQQAADMPRVRFLGFRDDIPDLLAAADVFALTSHLEGLGTAVIDAMCCGLPVVATRAGGIPELISDGETGLLATVRDPASCAGALGRVLGDADLRQRLGLAARSASERFSAAAMVAGYQRLYAEVAP